MGDDVSPGGDLLGRRRCGRGGSGGCGRSRRGPGGRSGRISRRGGGGRGSGCGSRRGGTSGGGGSRRGGTFAGGGGRLLLLGLLCFLGGLLVLFHFLGLARVGVLLALLRD